MKGPSKITEIANAIARLLDAIRSWIPNRKAPPDPVDPPRPPDVPTSDVPTSAPTKDRR